MVDFKIDFLKLDTLELHKSKHDVKDTAIKDKIDKTNILSSNSNEMDPEELLFWSSSAPPMTQEQIEAMSYSEPVSPIKRKTKRINKDG